nr:hypothetical protein [Candidatus Sigynarchaeum springense]
MAWPPGAETRRATSLAGPHGAGRGGSPARDELVDDGRTFRYRQCHARAAPHGARARAGWKRAASAESAERSDSRYGLSGLGSVLVLVERRVPVLARAATGLAAQAASLQQLGNTAAMILPRWKRLRFTF